MIAQATIFGLGLIGGSISLALRAIEGVQVAAVDAEEVLELPEARVACHERVPVDDEWAVRRLLERTELAILAVPVGAIMKWMPEVLARARFVTDCGSTKVRIAMAAQAEPRRRYFVPGHPMAGRAVGGLANASPTLFRGARWLLCSGESDPEAVGVVEGLVTALGAQPLHLDPGVHDRGVALTSHMLQLCASALAALASREEAWDLAGPAFSSATRVAGGVDSMWRDIFATNGVPIARAIRALTSELDSIADELERSPTELRAALRLLEEARQAMGPRQTGG